MTTRTIFVLIFEGRTGSSETIARLNQHPAVQAYPEILAPLCTGETDNEWEAVDDVFRRLRDGRSIDTFTESYSKTGPAANSLPIRGFKTRLNVLEDRWWYEGVGRPQNFYAVDPMRFANLAGRYNAILIYLHRHDVLRQAISWLRAVELASHNEKWNVLRSEEPPGPITLDPASVVRTVDWIVTVQFRHQSVFENYPGRKWSVAFEELMAEGGRGFDELLAFLGAAQIPLTPHYRRATSENLREAVANYDALMEHLRDYVA